MEEDILKIKRLCEKIGWDIALPVGEGSEDDGNIHGMIIGEDSYVNYILKHLE